MTYAVDSTVVQTAMELLFRESFGGFPEALMLLLNEAMKAERSAVLGAGPHERSPGRRGYVNGYEGKAEATRVGELALKVSQVRGEVKFYPSVLERGVRSERALNLALAVMYVQGVSTRRVFPNTESVPRLVTALLMEQSEEWKTGKVYLTMTEQELNAHSS